ncbi:MAG: class I SAM-dependent methyltransferase [Rhodospirillaceae bacterium]|nr:class I SAM-dependent methyltransferase [Rhodospirillaceae bacterium]
MERRNNTDVVQEILDLPGKRVLDVGCGPGGLVRLMTQAGAKVVGLECGALPLAKAQATDPVGDETYLEGVGENIPFDDASFDTVIFFKSFHHVPINAQEKALSEAARVLVPGGVVYVSEPLAEGSSFELGRLIEDETVVRAAAFEVIKDAAKLGLTEIREVAYNHITKHKDFETFRDAKILVDADHEQTIRDSEETLRQTFERLGRKTEAGFEFDQPMRVNMLRKLG